MSDIIYTPPVVSGGGVNPTPYFLPVNIGGTFVDSVLYEQGGNTIKTVFSGSFDGFVIDDANKHYIIGTYTTGNLINLFINDTSKFISTYYSNTQNGLYIDFQEKRYLLGDFNATNNGSYIEINDANKLIRSYVNGIEYGFTMDFNSSVIYFGAVSTNDFIVLVTSSHQLSFYLNGSDFGNLDGINNAGYIGKTGASFRFDGNNFTSSIGDANGNNNSTFLLVNDDNRSVTLNAQNDIFINGANLQSNTSGGNSGEHLIITLNGNPYKIKLELP